MSPANSRRRASVSRDSRRNVGKILEGLGEVGVALRGRREHRFGFPISPRSWPRRSRAPGTPRRRCAPSRRTASFWLSSMRRTRSADSRTGRARRSRGEVRAAPLERERLALHPGLECRAGLRRRRGRSRRAGPTRPHAQPAACRPRAAAACVSVARAQLDVGLAEQCLLAKVASVRGYRRILVGRSRSHRRPGRCRSSSMSFTFPTDTPEIRTSDSCASWLASSSGTVNR